LINISFQLECISSLRNELEAGKETQVITLTEGTTSIQNSQTGGTSSTTIDAKIGLPSESRRNTTR